MPLSPVELHGAITHLPLAFLLAVPVFEIGAVVLRKPEWRVVSFWLLAAAVLLAVPALLTGWVTAADLKFTGPQARPPALFAWHRLAAFTTTGLAALLLWWRVRTGDALQGAALRASIALASIIAIVVGATGFMGGRMVFGAGGQNTAYVPVAQSSTNTHAEPDGATPQLVSAGQKLFATLPCQSCHRMDGKGGVSGPDLTHEAQRHAEIDWHIQHLRDPQKMKPDSDMPPFDSLSPAELRALAAFLATRK